MSHIESMKQALEALEDAQTYISEKYEDHILGYQMHPATESERLVIVDSAKLNEQAITALRQAIATEESSATQEPVAYRSRMRNRDGQIITGWVVHLDTTENPDPRVEIEPLYTHPQPKAEQEFVATAWDEGYQAGVHDERMSEANIGIAGFNAKVEPARNNPYRTHPQIVQQDTQPTTEQEPKRESARSAWVGLTDEEIDDAARYCVKSGQSVNAAIRNIEAKLKEKNMK